MAFSVTFSGFRLLKPDLLLGAMGVLVAATTLPPLVGGEGSAGKWKPDGGRQKISEIFLNSAGIIHNKFVTLHDKNMEIKQDWL